MKTQILAFLDSLETKPSYSPSTCLAYGSDLRLFYDHLQSTLQRSPTLGDFDAHHVADFLEAERREGLRLSTLLRRRATLQTFERYLRQEGYVHERLFSPELHLIDRSNFAPQAQSHCLSPSQINQLWEVLLVNPRPLGQRDHAILAMLLETGLAVTKLISLNLFDIDMRSERFHLAGGEGQDNWMSLGSAVEPLHRYLEEGRPELNPGPDEPSLFISQNGLRMSRQSIWQVLHNSGKAAGLPYKLSPRLVRHTAALRLARLGRPISEIQLLLGHSNPLSTHALLHRLAVNNPL